MRHPDPEKLKRRIRSLRPRGIQPMIMATFTIISVILILITTIIFYSRFITISKEENTRKAEDVMKQSAINIENYLSNMRQISDSVYYGIIKDVNLSDTDIKDNLNLLYQSNSNNIVEIALFSSSGELLAGTPNASEKNDADPASQSWFKAARKDTANLHFSVPHIQNLFNDSGNSFRWVISLSRAVEITHGGESEIGVLLVDMDFNNVAELMKSLNDKEEGQYYYLSDSTGELIYHPRMIQISEGFSDETNRMAASHSDGAYREIFNKEKREIVIQTISYTGWRIVGAIPDSALNTGMLNIKLFVILIFLLTLAIIIIINRIVTNRITYPILRLDDSVKSYETGAQGQSIYIGGSTEIRHLGRSIQANYDQIEELIKDIKIEQDERRRSEIAALQSQINPHFLYNTLDSITWMVEGGKNDEASHMIQELARLFRISLSKGKNIISVSDEIQHARSYMNIQKVRYKDIFSVEFDVSPDIENACIVKLVVQPILENAIYYGVSSMDGDGEIKVRGRREGDDVIIEVSDNGMGMPPEVAANVLTETNHVHKHGNGVGLVNVHNRLKLIFGDQYGLSLESEPDEGTTVRIRIPYIEMTEENRTRLEGGRQHV